MKKKLSKWFYFNHGDKEIYSFQSFRFFFFLFIFVHHCYGNVEVPFLRQPALAVSGFFIMSGFLSGYINITKKYKVKDSIKYMLKRMKKIYPLHVVMLMLMIAISGIFNSTNLNELFLFAKRICCNLFLIQSWINNKKYFFSFNGVSWFLSTYIFLSLLTIPILLLLKKINQKKNKNIMLLLIAIVLFAITCPIVYFCNKNSINTEYWLYIFPPSRLFEYTIGIIVGIVFKNINNKNKPSSTVFSLLEFIAIVIMVVFIYFDIQNQFLFLTGRLNAWILPISFLLFVFAHQRGVFSFLFSFKPLVYLGNISMYMFMIHQPLIIFITKYTGKTIHYRYLGLYMLLLTVLLATVINMKHRTN